MIILFNKPYNVLTKFTDPDGRSTLADYIDIPRVYAAGRLDMDSEGLLLLTDSGKLNHDLTDPENKAYKTYVVQVEGIPTKAQLKALEQGIELKDGMTLPAKVKRIPYPKWLWEREKPIRVRQNQPTSFLQIKIKEGRNRQVRRMTAAVGIPTLRLIRTHIDAYNIGDLKPGMYRVIK
ncbi:rRNA large subunit pseudouridine synthase E [Leuconostoc gelidum]|uniref:rRNA large subunit pseudouridine synthase E n=1 Tax=Leuconostoc gelidum TaxID=1244 RepID=UPI0002191EC6|nr:rRNA large subunit pseudouridine synthase E [Leuconostoc gelidum]AFS41245.1 ribosomal large subunit pseudouridine synthase E [Leuconostoc gelidum JB7]MBZ5992154.1 rRNA large subunit pseudouridine synthase E [Leuconostoc gelidum subsp. gelidum]USP17378.1 rRNA large subunit pseudouridine synthase E [Leuconostoc gelidum subsp. aenigmaticum]GMA67325.1 pseudouridine synthase [Leuconostoc gelidum subsp. gelidum]